MVRRSWCLTESDLVRLCNDRGACLAAARISEEVMPGVVRLPTCAWFDVSDDGPPGLPLKRHGNPIALTLDKGTSRLAQGSSAHTERFDAEPVAILAHEPPRIASS